MYIICFVRVLYMFRLVHPPPLPPLGKENKFSTTTSKYSFFPVTWPPLWSSGQSSWLHNGDILCFLWGTNWIYTCYVEESRPPLRSSGQSSWIHNGDVLCLLWGTNWIYTCYVEESRPPLRSSGQSSWIHNGDILYFLWGTYVRTLCRRT
jgi:hypothetical protein